MSELIKTNNDTAATRWQLLASVSAFALLVSPHAAAASEEGKPTVWIELGGQLERISSPTDPYLPPFTRVTPAPAPFGPVSPAASERAPRYSYGGEGKLVFVPESSDWVFSVGIRYGRSNGSKHIHQQSVKTQSVVNPKYQLNPTAYPTPTIIATAPRFFDSKVTHNESHFVMDFQAGRDVGLGLFGRGGSSTFGFGVRAAEFTYRRHVGLISRPDPEIYEYKIGFFSLPMTRHNDFFGSAGDRASFHGIGPSLTWNASAQIAGNEDQAITFDWGLNGALLFGRQKAKGSHHETQNYYQQKYYQTVPPYGVQQIYAPPPVKHDRSRSVVVPNIGGFAGLSYRYQNAKVSFGYRADMFFGAMDVGIDARRTADRDFHGPFARISIGFP
jgi:hypothetical protein